MHPTSPGLVNTLDVDKSGLEVQGRLIDKCGLWVGGRSLGVLASTPVLQRVSMPVLKAHIYQSY